jgi:hypothetical protein
MKHCGKVNWINVLHNRFKLHAVANTVLYFWVLQIAESLITNENVISISNILILKIDLLLLLRLGQKIFIVIFEHLKLLAYILKST